LGTSNEPLNAAQMKPTATPRKIEMRPRKPRKSTAKRMIATRVIVAVAGSSAKLLQAVGARLKPMSATMAPATTGGIRASTQRRPTNCTTSPTTARSTPTATTPARAEPVPPAATAAVMGAMKANEEPR